MSEERDLEKELKEEKERFDAQNQEAYDKEVSGEAELKRQEEKRIRKGEKRRYQRLQRKQTQTGGNTGEKFIPDKTGDFAPAPDRDMRTGEPIYDPETDQFGNPRLAESITFETGANLALDKATSLLLGAPVPGARALYALSNVAGSGIINYLAQRIRGTEFSLGELATASGLSLIPGATQAKTLKGAIGKSTSKGAATGATAVTSESLIDTGELPDAETLATGALFGGAAGGIFETATKGDDIGKFLNNVRNRINGGKQLITPEGIPIDASDFQPSTAFAMGGPGSGRKKKIKPNPDQLGLFENEGDQFLYEKYKAQNKVIGTPLPKRQQAGRALRPSDFDDIIEEYPEITPDLIFNYIESTKAGRFGRGVRNPDTGRLKRNNRGLEGTLKFLNRKAAPDANFDLSEIAAELSAEFNKTITPKTLSNIIDENVDQGTFTFKTRGMSKPIEIKSIDDLRKAYMGRVARYRGIPAFERGHVFAADNIIKDNKIKNLTDFKNNLEPEIARSIYAQLDDQALDELIKANVDGDFSDIESLYKSILDGNRSRKNLDDPDKVIAALYGRDY